MPFFSMSFTFFTELFEPKSLEKEWEEEEEETTVDLVHRQICIFELSQKAL